MPEFDFHPKANFTIRKLVAIAKESSCRWPRLLMAAWIVLSIALIRLSSVTKMPENLLDQSWQMTLAYALDHHLQFGPQCAFTYGPLGALLACSYYPTTWLLNWVFWIILALSLALEIDAQLFVGWQKSAWSWLMLVSLPLLPWLAETLDSVVFAYIALFTFRRLTNTSSTERPTLLPEILGSLTLALLSLTKFTFAVAAFSGMIAVAAACFAGRKMPPAAVPLYLALLPVVWIISGQNPGNVPTYLFYCWQIASGYSKGMSSVHPSDPGSQFVLLLSGLLAIILALRLAIPISRRVLLSAWLGLWLLLVYKAGYVRQDGHVLITAQALTLLLILILPRMLTLEKPSKSSAIAAVLSLSLAFGGLCYVFADYLKSNVILAVPQALGYEISVVQQALSGKYAPAVLLSGFRQRAEEIRQQARLPAISGSIDIYPSACAVPIFLGLNFTPRPVFQSYTAYTPALQELNKEYLRQSPADNLLFAIDTLDMRLPALDDGYSWPEIWARYEIQPSGSSSPYLLLKKRRRPRKYELQLVKEQEFYPGNPVKIEEPASDRAPLFISIEPRLTKFALPVALFYKILPLQLTLVSERGEISTYKMPIGMPIKPFPISPLITTKEQFAAMMASSPSPADAGPMVRVLTLEDPDNKAPFKIFRKSACLKLYRLHWLEN